jgi:signal transduction histidine kinase
MSNIVFGVFIAFLLLCLVILFCIILLKQYIFKIKKYNKVIYEKEIEQQKAVNQTIIETQEETLNNISEELHDDAGQQLTYINFQLENLKLTNPEIKDNIIPLSDSVGYLTTSIRNLSHSINSHKFKNFKLVDSIRNELEKVNKLNVLDCRLYLKEGFDYIFSTNENIVLFRIFQEILNNALKHSKAQKFSLTIAQVPYLHFEFKDDGVGFSEENDQIMSSLGIQNIKKRAQLINFSFEFHSEINQGTLIRLFRL